MVGRKMKNVTLNCAFQKGKELDIRFAQNEVINKMRVSSSKTADGSVL